MKWPLAAVAAVANNNTPVDPKKEKRKYEKPRRLNIERGVEIGKKNRKRRVHIAHIGIRKSGRDLGSKASHIGKNAPAREPAAQLRSLEPAREARRAQRARTRGGAGPLDD